MNVADGWVWLDGLEAAWRNRDPEAAAELFTDDAAYQSHPFRTGLKGGSEIAAYWASATRGQTDIDVTFGEPLVAGNKMAVEWWSTMNEGGLPVTEAGELFLTFDNGRCSGLREYWNLTDGTVALPAGWGR